MEQDQELMAEIETHAERAMNAAPRLLDLWALAQSLHNYYRHRTPEEIHQKLKDHWRAVGLYCN